MPPPLTRNSPDGSRCVYRPASLASRGANDIEQRRCANRARYPLTETDMAEASYQTTFASGLRNATSLAFNPASSGLDRYPDPSRHDDQTDCSHQPSTEWCCEQVCCPVASRLVVAAPGSPYPEDDGNGEESQPCVRRSAHSVAYTAHESFAIIPQPIRVEKSIAPFSKPLSRAGQRRPYRAKRTRKAAIAA